MEFKFSDNVLNLKKVMSDLDKLVLDFIKILNESKIKYVVISGYVSILLGRTRTTEDVDMFIEKIDFKKFKQFFNILDKKGYWILNATDIEEPFDMLNDKLAIRIALKNQVIPNFEIKFPKKDTDYDSLNSPLKIVVNGKTILTSRLEMQIPFKLWLGSDKDIEDAIHIYELFKDNLDRKLLKDTAIKLKVVKEMEKNGIK